MNIMVKTYSRLKLCKYHRLMPSGRSGNGRLNFPASKPGDDGCSRNRPACLIFNPPLALNLDLCSSSDTSLLKQFVMHTNILNRRLLKEKGNLQAYSLL